MLIKLQLEAAECPKLKELCTGFAVFKVRVFPLCKKEASEQYLHIASNFKCEHIAFEIVLGFTIDEKTVQKSFWICAST